MPRETQRITTDETLTTGQVCKLCNVASRTVAKWADSGKLKCFRLPDSLDRRFYRDDVVAFMKAGGFRIPPELLPRHVYAFGLAPWEKIEGALCAASGFDLAVLCAREVPRAVVIGDCEGRELALELAHRVRQMFAEVPITLVLSEDAAALKVELSGVSVVRRPCDWQRVAVSLAAA